MASPNHDQHLSTNSQFMRCQYESYVIVHHCPSLSCLFHFIPISKTLFSQSEIFSPRENRQPWESSEHRVRWMHLSLPTASLVAPATEYWRRLDWHEKVSGLVRDTWNDPLVLLGCGSLKKAEPKSGSLTSCDSHTHTHNAHGASRKSRFQRWLASIIADGAFNHKQTAQI